MIKFLIDLLQFLYSTLPLITCVTVFTLLAVWLSKSIKKHAKIYYIVLALPSLMFAIPFIGRWFGLELFSFGKIPFLGGILRDYMHMATFGFPLLIVIMYMGALDMKIPFVKKLMNIRKELSIISGFPILTHSLVRVVNNFPGSVRFFFDNEEYMANKVVVSEFGAFLTNFSYILGILMVVLFLVLWITSFDSVHKRMGGLKWKKVQKWSYVLYAMLFIHSMGIQIGGLLNPRGGENSQRAAIENTQNAAPENDRNNSDTANIRQQANFEESGRKNGENTKIADRRNKNRSESFNSAEGEHTHGNKEYTNPEKNNRKRHTENSENSVQIEAKQGDNKQSTEVLGSHNKDSSSVANVARGEHPRRGEQSANPERNNREKHPENSVQSEAKQRDNSRNTEAPRSRNKNSSGVVNTANGEHAQSDEQIISEKDNGKRNAGSVQSEIKQNNNQQEQVVMSGRDQGFGFSDIKISSQAKRYIHIISVVLIFGSYLFLRLRKARKNTAKKRSKTITDIEI